MKLLCTMSVDWLSLRNLFTQKFVKNKIKLEVFNQNNPSMEIRDNLMYFEKLLTQWTRVKTNIDASFALVGRCSSLLSDYSEKTQWTYALAKSA